MAKCLVVYASKYGSTKEVAQAVADGLGADVAAAASHPDIRSYDLIVLGCPIYGGDYLDTMVEFVRSNKPDLTSRQIAAFITAAADWEVEPGLTGERDDRLWTQDQYAEGLARLTGGDVLGFRGFGGRLRPEDLDQRDYEMLNWFYRFLMREPLKGFDMLDLSAAFRWGEELREMVGN